MSIERISPTVQFQRWLLENGGNTSRQATNILARQMRKDAKGRADGSKRFRGSLIGDPCDRKQALSYIGAEQGYSDLTYAVSGTWAHNKWQACGLTMGWLSAIEVPVKYGKFKGSIDGITSDNRVFELKTTRSTVLKYLKEPKEQAVKQVNLYMFCAGLKEAVIVYEGREDLTTKEFDIELDMDLVNDLINQTQSLLSIVNAGKIPPMHPKCTFNSVMRNYCSFQETCLERWAGE